MLNLDESRYDRQERISWWDQERLRAAQVLVVGAGALGNEIAKNLALVGVGSIDIVDMDRIEHSNLARCALFRDADEGRMKAEALAEAVSALNPEVKARAFTCKVQDLGTGWLARYDAVIAGLDSREARMWVNATCRRLGMPWIDGAIEGLQGVVRMFWSDGPCYECTLGEADRLAISHRRSCALLSPDEIQGGRTPTNATTASVVAAFEVQEAIKLIVGRPELLALRGRVWRLDGETMLTSVMEYTEDPDCLAHDLVEAWFDAGDAATLGQVMAAAGGSVVYLTDDLIEIGSCETCGAGERIVGLRPCLPDGAGTCACGGSRAVASRTSIEAGDALADERMSGWAWPRDEIVTVRGEQGYVSARVQGSGR